MNFEFDSDQLVERLDTKYEKLTHCVETIILPDGRLAEVQIVLTTIQSEFCEQDKMRGVLRSDIIVK